MSDPTFELGRRDWNPQIQDDYSPLHTLAENALREFGDFAPLSADGEVIQLFLRWGNRVINDVRGHPYWPLDVPLDYYQHATDRRPVPDVVVEAGLLMHYAKQQASDKYGLFGPEYTRALSDQLWQRISSNRPISLRVMDDGSNPRYRNSRRTSVINGQVYAHDPLTVRGRS